MKITPVAFVLFFTFVAGADFDPKKEMAKEGKGLKLLQVDSKESAFSFSAKAKKVLGQNAERANDQWLVAVEFDVGAESAVNCQIRDGDADLAASIDNVFSAIIKIHGATESEISKIDAGAIGNGAYIRAARLYAVTKKEGSKALGYAKMASASLPGAFVLCVHDELGYEKTFFELFDSIVLSLKNKEKGENITPRLIYRVSIGKQPVGVAIQSGLQGENQRTIHAFQSGMLIPADNHRWNALDEGSAEIADQEGRIQSGIYVSIKTNEGVSANSHEIELTSSKVGDYLVKGKKDGKTIQASFKNADLLSSGAIDRWIRKDLVDKKKEAVSYAIYSPGLTVSKGIPVEYAVDKRVAQDRIEGTQKIGEMKIQFRFEKDRFVRQVMSLGAGSLTFELVHGNP